MRINSYKILLEKKVKLTAHNSKVPLRHYKSFELQNSCKYASRNLHIY